MIEALLMLCMLVFVWFMLIHAKRLTGNDKKKKPLIQIFEFNTSLDKTPKPVRRRR
jgi:hypothetical protein